MNSELHCCAIIGHLQDLYAEVNWIVFPLSTIDMMDRSFECYPHFCTLQRVDKMVQRYREKYGPSIREIIDGEADRLREFKDENLKR